MKPRFISLERELVDDTPHCRLTVEVIRPWPLCWLDRLRGIPAVRVYHGTGWYWQELEGGGKAYGVNDRLAAELNALVMEKVMLMQMREGKATRRENNEEKVSVLA